MIRKSLDEILLKTQKTDPDFEFLSTLWAKFDKTTVAETLKEIELKCKERSFPLTLETRLKTISVEILQNISKHSSLSQDLPAYFVLTSDFEKMMIYSGNMVAVNLKDLITERLSVYTSLDVQELKNFYRHSLENTSITESGNAGIGLLDIVYRSGQRVQWHFEDHNSEFCYFEMTVTVKKQMT